VSVHRLQAFVFNVIYGVAFFTHFVGTEMFQTYDRRAIRPCSA